MTRVRVTLSPISLDDLQEISDYIAKDNRQVAQAFVKRLKDRCFSLKDYPRIGRNRTDIRPNMRSITEGNYVILYRCLPSEVEIARVLHSKRDVKKAFGDRD